MVTMFNYGSNNCPITGISTTSSSSIPNSITFTDSDTSVTLKYFIDDRYTDSDSTCQETEKQKITRVAKEKMFASWKTHNQKTEKINKVIQVCKPRHRLSHMGRR